MGRAVCCVWVRVLEGTFGTTCAYTKGSSKCVVNRESSSPVATSKPAAVESNRSSLFRHSPSGPFGDWMEFPLNDPPDTAQLLPRIKYSYGFVQLAAAKKSRRARQRAVRQKAGP